MQHYKEWICIHTANEVSKYAVDEIIYVIADGNYSDLYLVDGQKKKFTFQLHYFEERFSQLRRNPFTRVGRSAIINKDHIRLVSIPERKIYFGGLSVVKTIQPLQGGRDSLKDLKKELNEEPGQS
ncbi:MAG: LytTR family transcriptional regulator DNA-binding domain-containing protein [Muribaculaceae bacterium]|nr:LytTR family transcriptional regulator DNA-binding domain-containing protein [Muribaculaceae bacterium]